MKLGNWLIKLVMSYALVWPHCRKHWFLRRNLQKSQRIQVQDLICLLVCYPFWKKRCCWIWMWLMQLFRWLWNQGCSGSNCQTCLYRQLDYSAQAGQRQVGDWVQIPNMLPQHCELKSKNTILSKMGPIFMKLHWNYQNYFQITIEMLKKYIIKQTS